MSDVLKDLYPDVDFEVIDVFSAEMKKYPKVEEYLPKIKLPLTAINGVPMFHGGLSLMTIANAIDEILENE